MKKLIKPRRNPAAEFVDGEGYEITDVMPRRQVKPAPKPERSCGYCGCTDRRASPGGCHWIERRLNRLEKEVAHA